MIGRFLSGVNCSKASWAVLAALRFVLALIVFDGHLWWAGLPSSAAFLPLGIGRAGVVAFLLISGVSIGYSYSACTDGFYARRFLRIYPLYFAAIVFSVIVMGLVPAPARLPSVEFAHVGWPTVAGNLLFLQGLAVIPLPYDGPLWSLSVEVWLYALTPLFFRLPRWVLYAFIAVSMFFFVFQGGIFIETLPGLAAIKWCWPWWIGFLLARDGRKAPALGLGVVGASLFTTNAQLSSGASANIALFSLTLAAVLWADRAKLPRIVQNVANFLGDVSYPLYLFHLPVIILLFVRFGVRAELGFVVTVLALVVALVVFYEDRLKPFFWKPLIFRLVQWLPPSWTLLRPAAGHKTPLPVASASTLVSWPLETPGMVTPPR